MTIAKNSNLIPTICKIFFAPISDIYSISIVTDRFHRLVTFKNSKAWQEVYFTPGSADFTEKPKDTDPGELIEQSLKFMFPGEDDTNLVALDAILGRPGLVKIEYTGDVSKLMGDLENGAKITQNYQISAKGTGSQLEASCMATYRACWVSE